MRKVSLVAEADTYKNKQYSDKLQYRQLKSVKPTVAKLGGPLLFCVALLEGRMGGKSGSSACFLETFFFLVVEETLITFFVVR